MDRGDGACVHFDEVLKQCQIYAERPDICRVDRQYKKNYRLIMTWNEFVELNQVACKKLQEA
ncbi:YkgJ family cysteine cluster protein [Halomonas kashgarensis]|uniref:YkgJ family cysteine cluster protein n=1 Tax=Halomonas kashgarensis TaxID=3084920 RepID=UPI003A8D2276